MNSLEYKQCPACKTVGNWRPSHARGLIEQKLFPLLRCNPYRCTICRRRAVVFGDRQPMPGSETKIPGGREPSRGASPARQDDEEFRQLIAELRRSEESMEQDEPR